MFERFTDRARRVVVLAQESTLAQPQLSAPEHLLLGADSFEWRGASVPVP